MTLPVTAVGAAETALGAAETALGAAEAAVGLLSKSSLPSTFE